MGMKSSRQRRKEISDGRAAWLAARAEAAKAPKDVPVNEANLAPYNSYGAPDFVERGYYRDKAFVCGGCGKKEVWTAAQQKWWYEVAKGYVYSTAKLCRACRKREQARRVEARRVQQEGMERKKAGRGT